MVYEFVSAGSLQIVKTIALCGSSGYTVANALLRELPAQPVMCPDCLATLQIDDKLFGKPVE